MRSKFLAELIGTFTIVFAGCGSLMVAERFPSSISGSSIPVIFGLAVAVMIYAVGHISGAHFNPAVTTAFALVRHFPVKQVIPYWLAQFSGAILASLLLRLILPEGSVFGATTAHVMTLAAIVWEIVLTFFLMFVIIAVATDTRAVGMMAGLAIGGTVALGAFVGGAITGASMNPARSFGPALISWSFDNIWIYFIGPVIGAVMAAFLYEYIRCETPAPESNSKDAKGCC